LERSASLKVFLLKKVIPIAGLHISINGRTSEIAICRGSDDVKFRTAFIFAD